MTFESIIAQRAATSDQRIDDGALRHEVEELRSRLAADQRLQRRPDLHISTGWWCLKRVLDVTLGGLLAIASLPIIALLSLGVAIALREFPFFVHDRVGKDGKTFRMPKIRTLPSIVPPYADKNELDSYDIPRLCRFLRASHLDELPQLILVVLGKMSLVGPRPHWDEPIDPAYLVARTTVRPGCAGLWQVGRHTHLNCVQTPSYDYFYIANSSLRLDIWILWRTLLAVTPFGRPIALGDVPRWTTRGYVAA